MPKNCPSCHTTTSNRAINCVCGYCFLDTLNGFETVAADNSARSGEKVNLSLRHDGHEPDETTFVRGLERQVSTGFEVVVHTAGLPPLAEPFPTVPGEIPEGPDVGMVTRHSAPAPPPTEFSPQKWWIFAAVAVTFMALGTYSLSTIRLSLSSTDNSASHLKSGPAAELIPAEAKLSPDTFEATVVEAVSGDTVIVRDIVSQQYRIKLAGVKAPEPWQPFGPQARENLARLAFDRSVTVVSMQAGRPGTMTGKLLFEGMDLGLEQIKSGFATYDGPAADESPESRRYAEAEASARNVRAGIWGSSRRAYKSMFGQVDVSTRSAETAAPEIPENAATAEPASSESSAASPDGNTPHDAPNSIANANVAVPEKTEPQPVPTNAEVAARETEDPKAAASPSPTVNSGQPNRTYILGPRGGCYYLSEVGTKKYVDRSLCP